MPTGLRGKKKEDNSARNTEAPVPGSPAPEMAAVGLTLDREEDAARQAA